MNRSSRTASGRAAFACGLALALLVTATARAQSPVSLSGPWSAGISMGAGHLDVTTDQGRGGQRNVFQLGFRGSRAVSERWRVGLELGGWLLEGFNANDPAEGESVSTAGGFVQLYPFRAQPVFVEGGFGLATYTNSAPLEFDTRGTGWSAGAGYAFATRGRLWATIGAHLSGGAFRDVRNAVTTETGWRYAAFDFRLTGGLRFGKRAD